METVAKFKDSTTPGATKTRSEGSAPSSAGNNPQGVQKKPKQEGQAEARPSTSAQDVTRDTYGQALTALKMAVVLEGSPENKLTEEQSKKVQQAMLG
jgi:hypothetical protein